MDENLQYEKIRRKQPLFPVDPLSSSITIQKKEEQGLTSTLTINLAPYIQSFKAAQNKPEDSPEQALYRATFNSLRARALGYASVVLWADLLTLALENSELSESDKKILHNSPASTFIENSFGELIKNLIDEAIIGHYEEGRSCALMLELSLALLSDKTVCFSLMDTGRGFPCALLNELSTPERQLEYIGKEASSLKAQQLLNCPPLCGGKGLGLRILLAQVLLQSDLGGPTKLTPVYQKPEHAAIVFKQRSDATGSMIQITTSIAPLKHQEISFHTAPMTIPFELKLPFFKKKVTSKAAEAHAHANGPGS